MFAIFTTFLQLLVYFLQSCRNSNLWAYLWRHSSHQPCSTVGSAMLVCCCWVQQKCQEVKVRTIVTIDSQLELPVDIYSIKTSDTVSLRTIWWTCWMPLPVWTATKMDTSPKKTWLVLSNSPRSMSIHHHCLLRWSQWVRFKTAAVRNDFIRQCVNIYALKTFHSFVAQLVYNSLEE